MFMWIELMTSCYENKMNTTKNTRLSLVSIQKKKKKKKNRWNNLYMETEIVSNIVNFIASRAYTEGVTKLEK